MNQYTKLKKRQQEEFNALPLGFAFTEEQFEKMMRNWELDPKADIDKICRIVSNGYIQKKDLKKLQELSKRHKVEREEAIANDKTGDNFIYHMFLCELNNTEYGYTGNETDALEALDLTWEQLQADKRLLHGFEKASKRILENA